MADNFINYHILIPAWGKRYVKRALDYCLASLMSKNNIQAVASTDRVTVVFLTEQSSHPFFAENAVLRGLPPHVEVAFVWIDDLLKLSSYGVILTLAYARAIQRHQDGDPTPVFIFANADFVFSDGALGYIGKTLRAGFDGIACPSVRCVEDQVLERMDALRGPDGALDLSCDFLIRQVYDFPHMTDFAATLGSRYLHHTNPNHFFIGDWKRRLLGFWYLRSMLAIRPANKFDRVRSFCDYSFMTQMVPAERVHRPTDGHDVFLLELSDAHQEGAYVALGPDSLAQVAERLQLFTTADHRENGRYPYLIDLDRSEEGRAELLRSFHEAQEEIEENFTISPYDWRAHPYWHSALIRLASQNHKLPAELVEGGAGQDSTLYDYTRIMMLRARIALRNPISALRYHLIESVFAPIVRLVFQGLFAKRVPYLDEIVENIKAGDAILVSPYTVSAYIHQSFGEGVPFVRTPLELPESPDKEAESQNIIFIGSAEDFIRLDLIIRNRANARLAFALIVTPRQIGSKSVQLLLGLFRAQLGSQVLFYPRGGDLFIKAESTLFMLNRKSGFSLASRAAAVGMFLIESVIVERLSKIREKLGAGSQWAAIAVSNPKSDVVDR